MSRCQGREHLAACLQCFLQQRLRFAVTALQGVECGQVNEAIQCVRVAAPRTSRGWPATPPATVVPRRGSGLGPGTNRPNGRAWPGVAARPAGGFAAAGLQRLLKQWFRVAVAVLSLVQNGQVAEAGQSVRVAGPEHLAASLQRLLKQWFRVAVAALGEEGNAQYRGGWSECQGGGAQHFTPSFQSFLIQWFRLVVARLGLIDEGQAVEGRQRVRMC